MQIFNYDIYCKIYKSIVIYKNFEMCNFKYNKRFEHFNEIVWKVKVFQTYLFIVSHRLPKFLLVDAPSLLKNLIV